MGWMWECLGICTFMVIALCWMNIEIYNIIINDAIGAIEKIMEEMTVEVIFIYQLYKLQEKSKFL